MEAVPGADAAAAAAAAAAAEAREKKEAELAAARKAQEEAIRTIRAAQVAREQELAAQAAKAAESAAPAETPRVVAPESAPRAVPSATPAAAAAAAPVPAAAPTPLPASNPTSPAVAAAAFDGAGGGGGSGSSGNTGREIDDCEEVDPALHVAQMKKMLREFWRAQEAEIDDLEVGAESDYKTHNDLPLARIKRIMKSDEDVRMISAEAPVLFAKACEMFILELTLRAWCYSEQNKRRTLTKEDIQMAIRKTDIFDFLVDVIE